MITTPPQRDHLEHRLDGELTERVRVHQRLVDRRADFVLALEQARRAHARWKEAQKSFELMEERIAFIELTMAELDA